MANRAGERKAGERKVVAFAVGSSDAGHRALPRVVRGAIEWGNQCGWEMVDLQPWMMRLPASLQPDGLITHLGYSDRTLAKELHRAVPNSVSIDSASSS